VEEGRRKLKEHYASKGYNNVQVTILEGNKPTDQGVVYLINEGQAQKVWKVRFIGNEFVSDGRLKTLIKSKPPILMLFKGFVDRERIDADVEALTAYYRSYGFFQARIGRKLDYNEKGNWIDLTFVIHEGPQYFVRNVRFLGNTKFEPAPLAENVTLAGGQAFEQAKMQKDAQWLQELYGSHGYVFADVKPETVFLEEPGHVDLVYHIEEGKRFRVGRIFVHIGGDTPHTRIQTALNRTTVVPGQIMDIRELKASERRLIASSLFHSDPASGVRPKITYRIPEDAELDFGEESPRTASINGQSPDAPGAPLLPPPSALARLAPPPSPYAAHRPIDAPLGPADIHVFCINEEHFERWAKADKSLTDPNAIEAEGKAFQRTEALRRAGEAPAATAPADNAEPAPVFRGQSPQPAGPQDFWWAPSRAAAPHVAQKPPGGAYDAIRGQSPAGAVNQAYATVPAAGQQQPPQVIQAYATVPTAGSAAAPYGGQVVGATGPATAPVGGAVQPAQYSPQLQPPAGSIYPTPLNTQGPLPYYSVDPASPLYVGPGLPNYPEGTVDVFIEGQETQTGRLMVGVGVNSDAGVVGNIVVDERNFDWTRMPRSFEDIRNGYAFRGAGQRFRIDASPGSQVSRYLVSWQEPYLWDEPISLGLSGSYFDRRFRDWDEQRMGGRISLGRQWVERDLSATISYRGENINIHDPSVPLGVVPELDEALGDNVLHGFRLSVINDTRDNAFLATQGHYFEVAGEQVIGTFDYPRVEADFRQYWMLSERPDHSGRHVLSYSTTVGYTGTHTPIYEHFFAGGFATLRGFDFRGASPVKNGVELGGEFQWLNSLQYLFPITADDMLHGVAFVDFGTVEEDVEIKDFRVAPGLGLRITVPAMGPAPIALDFAYAVNRADFDDREIFSFSLGFSR
jgi:outer membrane protein insertion porin family